LMRGDLSKLTTELWIRNLYECMVDRGDGIDL